MIQEGRESGKRNDYGGKDSWGRKAADIIPDSSGVSKKHHWVPFIGEGQMFQRI